MVKLIAWALLLRRIVRSDDPPPPPTVFPDPTVDSEAIERYKDLYLLAKEVLNEEQNRFNRIEAKATTFLTVLTFLLGVAGFFGNWMVEHVVPPRSPAQWTLLVVGALTIGSLVTTCALLFRVLKQAEHQKLPLDQKVIDLFSNNSRIDVYFAMTKATRNAVENNRRFGDEKSRRLFWGYWGLYVTGALLVILTLVFGWYRWTTPIMTQEGQMLRPTSTTQTQPNGMAPQTVAGPRPNPNVPVPFFPVVTEGYDPVQARRVEDSLRREDARRSRDTNGNSNRR